MREERGQLPGDLIIYEPWNLWGSVGGKVTVIQNGKLYVRGAIYGDLVVEFGGRVHVFGHITGNIIVQRGGKLIHSGVLGGNAINEGGRLFIDATATIMGKVKTIDGDTEDKRKATKA
jgi:hypothetical protein